MKIFLLSFLSCTICLSSWATKYFVNQLPSSGNALSISTNVGDTVVFNLSNSFSVRQVSESTWASAGTNSFAGAFSFSGSGQVAIVNPGTHYFVLIAPNGQVSKGSITATLAATKTGFSNLENPIETKLINNRLQIFIKTPNASGVITIHDLLGNTVLQTQADQNTEVSMAGHKSGVYFIGWKDGKSNFTKRIIYRADN